VSRLFITITITIVYWCILIKQIPPRILLFPTQYPAVCVRSCNAMNKHRPGFFPPSFHLSQSCINFPLCTHLFTLLRGSSIHAPIALFPLVHHRHLTPPILHLSSSLFFLCKSSPLIASKTFFHLSFFTHFVRQPIRKWVTLYPISGVHENDSVVLHIQSLSVSNVKNGRHDSRDDRQMTDNAQNMRDNDNRLNRVYICHPAHSRGTLGVR